MSEVVRLRYTATGRAKATALGALIVTACCGQDSLNVTKLFHWDDPTIPVGGDWLHNQYSGIWGYDREGREYAIIGSTIGVHIFDVTEPTTAYQADFVQGRTAGAGVISREYKTYGHYLYAVSDQGLSSLQIIDLQYLPDSVHVVYDSDELVNRGHTLAIDTANARLYISGGDADFRIYDLSDPELPVLLSDCAADIPWWETLVGYVHDCHVRDNIVWTDDADGLHVIDFNDVENPVVLGSMMNYPGQGYNHSSWLNADGTVLVMADETHGSPLKFVDATDVTDLEVIASVTTEVDSTSIAHNPFFVGNVAHVGYYYDGYWIWNAADPMQPVVLGYYDTCVEPNAMSYNGAWGAYPYLPSGNVLVSDIQTGLWVFDVGLATGAVPSSPAPSFRVWPTVTTDVVNVMRLNKGDVRVEVTDASGRRIISKRMTEGSIAIDLNGHNDGVYFVRVLGEKTGHAQRVVKCSER